MKGNFITQKQQKLHYENMYKTKEILYICQKWEKENKFRDAC